MIVDNYFILRLSRRRDFFFLSGREVTWLEDPAGNIRHFAETGERRQGEP